MDVLSTTILFFLILDPLGNVPIFLAHLEKCENRYRVLTRELILALLVLLAFLFFGRQIMNALQLEPVSISIAGAIILFIIALRMIFPASKQYGDEELESEPLLVPLAIPLFAGPSIMATLILLVSRHPDQMQVLTVSLLIAWFLSSLVLYSATALQRYLGKKGMIAIERLMGMVLVAIAVQMMVDGLRLFMQTI